MITTNTPIDDTIKDALSWDLEIDRSLGLAAKALEETVRGTSPLSPKIAMHVAYTCISLAQAWEERQVHALRLNVGIADLDDDPDET